MITIVLKIIQNTKECTPHMITQRKDIVWITFNAIFFPADERLKLWQPIRIHPALARAFKGQTTLDIVCWCGC